MYYEATIRVLIEADTVPQAMLEQQRILNRLSTVDVKEVSLRNIEDREPKTEAAQEEEEE